MFNQPYWYISCHSLLIISEQMCTHTSIHPSIHSPTHSYAHDTYIHTHTHKHSKCTYRLPRQQCRVQSHSPLLLLIGTFLPWLQLQSVAKWVTGSLLPYIQSLVYIAYNNTYLMKELYINSACIHTFSQKLVFF